MTATDHHDLFAEWESTLPLSNSISDILLRKDLFQSLLKHVNISTIPLYPIIHTTELTRALQIHYPFLQEQFSESILREVVCHGILYTQQGGSPPGANRIRSPSCYSNTPFIRALTHLSNNLDESNPSIKALSFFPFLMFLKTFLCVIWYYFLDSEDISHLSSVYQWNTLPSLLCEQEWIEKFFTNHFDSNTDQIFLRAITAQLDPKSYNRDLQGSISRYSHSIISVMGNAGMTNQEVDNAPPPKIPFSNHYPLNSRNIVSDNTLNSIRDSFNGQQPRKSYSSANLTPRDVPAPVRSRNNSLSPFHLLNDSIDNPMDRYPLSLLVDYREEGCVMRGMSITDKSLELDYMLPGAGELATTISETVACPPEEVNTVPLLNMALWWADFNAYLTYGAFAEEWMSEFRPQITAYSFKSPNHTRLLCKELFRKWEEKHKGTVSDDQLNRYHNSEQRNSLGSSRNHIAVNATQSIGPSLHQSQRTPGNVILTTDNIIQLIRDTFPWVDFIVSYDILAEVVYMCARLCDSSPVRDPVISEVDKLQTFFTALVSIFDLLSFEVLHRSQISLLRKDPFYQTRNNFKEGSSSVVILPLWFSIFQPKMQEMIDVEFFEKIFRAQNTEDKNLVDEFESLKEMNSSDNKVKLSRLAWWQAMEAIKAYQPTPLKLFHAWRLKEGPLQAALLGDTERDESTRFECFKSLLKSQKDYNAKKRKANFRLDATELCQGLLDYEPILLDFCNISQFEEIVNLAILDCARTVNTFISSGLGNESGRKSKANSCSLPVDGMNPDANCLSESMRQSTSMVNRVNSLATSLLRNSRRQMSLTSRSSEFYGHDRKVTGMEIPRCDENNFQAILLYILNFIEFMLAFQENFHMSIETGFSERSLFELPVPENWFVKFSLSRNILDYGEEIDETEYAESFRRLQNPFFQRRNEPPVLLEAARYFAHASVGHLILTPLELWENVVIHDVPYHGNSQEDRIRRALLFRKLSYDEPVLTVKQLSTVLELEYPWLKELLPSPQDRLLLAWHMADACDTEYIAHKAPVIDHAHFQAALAYMVYFLELVAHHETDYGRRCKKHPLQQPITERWFDAWIHFCREKRNIQMVKLLTSHRHTRLAERATHLVASSTVDPSQGSLRRSNRSLRTSRSSPRAVSIPSSCGEDENILPTQESNDADGEILPAEFFMIHNEVNLTVLYKSMLMAQNIILKESEHLHPELWLLMDKKNQKTKVNEDEVDSARIPTLYAADRDSHINDCAQKYYSAADEVIEKRDNASPVASRSVSSRKASQTPVRLSCGASPSDVLLKSDPDECHITPEARHISRSLSAIRQSISWNKGKQVMDGEVPLFEDSSIPLENRPCSRQKGCSVSHPPSRVDREEEWLETVFAANWYAELMIKRWLELPLHVWLEDIRLKMPFSDDNDHQLERAKLFQRMVVRLAKQHGLSSSDASTMAAEQLISLVKDQSTYSTSHNCNAISGNEVSNKFTSVNQLQTLKLWLIPVDIVVNYLRYRYRLRTLIYPTEPESLIRRAIEATNTMVHASELGSNYLHPKAFRLLMRYLYIYLDVSVHGEALFRSVVSRGRGVPAHVNLEILNGLMPLLRMLNLRKVSSNDLSPEIFTSFIQKIFMKLTKDDTDQNLLKEMELLDASKADEGESKSQLSEEEIARVYGEYKARQVIRQSRFGTYVTDDFPYGEEENVVKISHPFLQERFHELVERFFHEKLDELIALSATRAQEKSKENMDESEIKNQIVSLDKFAHWVALKGLPSLDISLQG